jgi:hypothetical protein
MKVVNYYRGKYLPMIVRVWDILFILLLFIGLLP